MNAPVPHLGTYRAAVDDLMLDIAAHTGPDDRAKTEMILTERLAEPGLAELLAATPRGVDGTLRALLHEVEVYRPNARSSARDLAALVRIHLLSRIDVMWWGRADAFESDADVLGSPDLIDLAATPVRVRFRRQATTLPHRAVRAVSRRIAPDRTPRTAGLRFTRVRPELAALIDGLSTAFTAQAPEGTPPLWVTSLTRSVSHQRHLRTLGYAAVLPGAHCTGYAIDVEMDWYRRFGAREALQRVLLERQVQGDVNVIDEGQAWHVCVGPDALPSLRQHYDTRIG